MGTYKIFTVALLTIAGLATAIGVSAQSEEPSVSMDQAVLKVQQDTSGKVLSAEPHRMGRRLEYRIKVLTPQGHVRVMAVPADESKGSTYTPVFTPSFKNPPGRNPGTKERH